MISILLLGTIKQTSQTFGNSPPVMPVMPIQNAPFSWIGMELSIENELIM